MTGEDETVISNAPHVQAYLLEAAPERKPVLEKMRLLCQKCLPGYEECMEYGMPCYKRKGRVEVSFASQKQYIALYVLKQEVLDSFRESLAAASIGKGCIRYTRPERMNFDVLEQLLLAAAASSATAC